MGSGAWLTAKSHTGVPHGDPDVEGQNHRREPSVRPGTASSSMRRKAVWMSKALNIGRRFVECGDIVAA